MAIVSTASILRWVMLRTMGMVIPYVSSNAFVGDDHSLALYLNSDVSEIANFYVICDGDR